MLNIIEATSKGFQTKQIFAKSKGNIIKGSKVYLRVFGRNELIPLSEIWTEGNRPLDETKPELDNINSAYLPGENILDSANTDLLALLRGEEIGADSVYIKKDGKLVRVEKDLYVANVSKPKEYDTSSDIVKESFYLDENGNYIPVEDILPPAYKKAGEAWHTFLSDGDSINDIDADKKAARNLSNGDSYHFDMIKTVQDGKEVFLQDQRVWAYDGVIYSCSEKAYNDYNINLDEPLENNATVIGSVNTNLGIKYDFNIPKSTKKGTSQPDLDKSLNIFYVTAINSIGEEKQIAVHIKEPNLANGDEERYIEIRVPNDRIGKGAKSKKYRFTASGTKLDTSFDENNMDIEDFKVELVDNGDSYQLKIDILVASYENYNEENPALSFVDGKVVGIKDANGKDCFNFEKPKNFLLDYETLKPEVGCDSFETYEMCSLFTNNEDESPVLNADIILLSQPDENGKVIEVIDFRKNDGLILSYLEEIRRLREELAFLESEGASKDILKIRDINKRVQESEKKLNALKKNMIDLYNKKIDELEKQIADLEAGDDPQKAEKIDALRENIEKIKAKRDKVKDIVYTKDLNTIIKRFQEEPIPTFYFNSDGVAVRINNFDKVEIDNSLSSEWRENLALKSILGKDKCKNHKPTFFHKDGYIEVEFGRTAKKTCYRLLDISNALIQVSFMGGIFTLPLAVLALPVAGVALAGTGVVALGEQVRKNAKQIRINNFTPEKLKELENKEINLLIEKEIKENVRWREKQIKLANELPLAEQETKIAEINKEYKKRFAEAVSKVDLLGDMAIASKYNAKKDKKIGKNNLYGRLQYVQERKAKRKGLSKSKALHDNPDLMDKYNKAKEEYKEQLKDHKEKLRVLKARDVKTLSEKKIKKQRIANLKKTIKNLKYHRDNVINEYMSKNGAIGLSVHTSRIAALKETVAYRQATGVERKQMRKDCKAAYKKEMSSMVVEDVYARGESDEFIGGRVNYFVNLYNSVTKDSDLQLSEDEIFAMVPGLRKYRISRSEERDIAETYQTEGQIALENDKEAKNFTETVHNSHKEVVSGLSNYNDNRENYEHLPNSSPKREEAKAKVQTARDDLKNSVDKGIASISDVLSEEREKFEAGVRSQIEEILDNNADLKDLLKGDLDVFTQSAYEFMASNSMIEDTGEKTEKPLEIEKKKKVVEALKDMAPADREKFIKKVQTSKAFNALMSKKNISIFKEAIGSIVGEDESIHKTLTSPKSMSRKAIAELYYDSLADKPEGKYSKVPTIEEKLILLGNHLSTLSSDQEVKDFIDSHKKGSRYKQLKADFKKIDEERLKAEKEKKAIEKKSENEQKLLADREKAKKTARTKLINQWNALLKDDLDVFANCAFDSVELGIKDEDKEAGQSDETIKQYQVAYALSLMEEEKRKKYIKSVYRSNHFIEGINQKFKTQGNEIIDSIVSKNEKKFENLDNLRLEYAKYFYQNFATSRYAKYSKSEPSIEEKLYNLAQHITSLAENETKLDKFISELHSIYLGKKHNIIIT